MLEFKTNVKIFIIEFVCAVLLEGFYAVSINGVGAVGLVSIGLLPALLMLLFAYNIKNRSIVIRCLYLSALTSFIYLSIIVHAQISLPFMLLVVAVAIGLFIKPRILLEYVVLSIITLIISGIIFYQSTSSESTSQLYVTYVMMYAFSTVTLLFIVIGVENYRSKMEEKNEIAREALEAKSNFLANMSHEIRTPMNAIYGMAELLGEKEFENEERDYIETIKKSSENLLSIINEILDFSKVDSGKMTLDHEPYDFNSLIQDVVSIIEFRLRDKNIELVTKIDDYIPKELIGDENKIRQILINILNNACKFTNRGTITLKMGWIFENEGKGTLMIDVTDTGIGISEENLSKLFTAFGQLNTKKNRNVEGTGLGLAICKKFLDLMGGTISVKSKIKEGSTFTMSIPQNVYDATPSKYSENCERQTYRDAYKVDFSAPSANVLIVDDNKVNRQVAGELVKLFGIEADMAESGLEAIDKIERHTKTYDLVFMDHMMPFMDGVEATRNIRKLETDYAKKVPIIALTANAINGVQHQFLSAGMNDYIAKPIKIEHLNDILRKWIPEKKQFEPGTTLQQVKEKQLLDYENMTRDEILESLEGVDIETGIKNCAGSKDIYYDLLQTYATSNLANVLNMYFDKEDLANYAVTAHSIKGASRNIGAHDIADKAYSLERAGERGDINYIWDNHDELLEEYTELLKTLKKIFFGYSL